MMSSKRRIAGDRRQRDASDVSIGGTQHTSSSGPLRFAQASLPSTGLGHRWLVAILAQHRDYRRGCIAGWWGKVRHNRDGRRREGGGRRPCAEAAPTIASNAAAGEPIGLLMYALRSGLS